MGSVSVTEAREIFSDLLNRVVYAGERVVLERRGKPLATIVSMDDLRLLETLEDELDVKAAEAVLTAPENREAVPWEKVKTELGLS